ncbi:MAG: phytanoyl-CoA dioxygenase family protein [Pseudomonadota bacterium]
MIALDLEHYLQQGFVSNTRVLSCEETSDYREALSQLIDRHSKQEAFSHWTYFKSHLLFEWVARLGRTPRIVQHVQSIVGTDVVLWNSFIPVKAPRSVGYFGWHQDATYWPVAPLDQMVSVWVALGRVSQSNGGMRVIPGSHRWGQMSHETTFNSASMLRRGQRITDKFSEQESVDLHYEPGEASFHHSYVVHGSGANESASWRLAVGFNYASADVVPTKGCRDSALYIAGANRNTAFLPERSASKNLGDEELREYERIREHSGQRYQNLTQNE